MRNQLKLFRKVLLRGCLLVILVSLIAFLPFSAEASTDLVLGAAGNFQIVSGGAITLGGAITGLDTGNTSTSTTAVNDLRSALANLSAAPATSVPADLGSGTYLPGTYRSAGGAAFAMTSNVILDGKNDCASKFVFITPAAMNTTAGISITLINGAKANHVFWVVGGAITTGAGANLAGNFLSSAAVTVGASTNFDGRILAMAAVTVGASIAFQGFPITGCTVPLGGLSISVPETLTSNSLNPGESVVIRMGSVSVSDTRGIGSGASWTVSTICSDLTDSSGNILRAEFFAYAVRDLIETGGLLLTSETLTSMSHLNSALTARSGAGNNSAHWIPLITVSVPIEQVAGTYIGSITHSVT
jgi:hypothetical protein